MSAQVVVQRIGVLAEPSYDFVAHVARKVRDGEVQLPPYVAA